MSRPDASSPPPPSSSSSSELHSFKSECAICLDEIRKEDGKAIFTAECSHSFHYDCITSNVKHGNRICPICRTQWKQVPLCEVESVSQRVFEDDEALPHRETEVQSDASRLDRQALEIKLFPEVSALAKPVTRGDFAVLVHLKADDVSDGRRTRALLDLIAVLDVSGSMDGVKLKLLKTAMGFLIQHLGETDRLSVIAFSTTARRLFPLRLMSATNKQVAIGAVNSLVSGGGINIAEGLKIGARVIEDRRWMNPVAGMMLLSDGQDNNTFSNAGASLRTAIESLLPSSCRIPIHTFGFGSDHDAELMHTISQVSSGTFSFVEKESVIQDAFAQCIGGLFSVVILEQVVEIECVDEQGLKISSIKSGSYRSRIASDARTATIDVGDIYAEEERDFLVILEIPCCDNGSTESESLSLLKVKCVYKDPVTKEIVRVESGELSIQRPMEVTGEEVVSMEVDRERNRFRVSQAISEARVLADGGDRSAAIEILKNCEREISETASSRSSDMLCQSLAAELSTLQERMRSRARYLTGGSAVAFSAMCTYETQRATACEPSVGFGSAGRVYQTARMSSMVKKSQTARKKE